MGQFCTALKNEFSDFAKESGIDNERINNLYGMLLENKNKNITNNNLDNLQLPTKEEFIEFINNSIKDNNLNIEKKPINIYAGTNENVEFSNFAIRPFKINVELDKGPKEFTFQSVEQGFHFYKALLANNNRVAKDILKTTNGSVLKRLTNKNNLKLTEEQVKEWDNTSKNIMLNLMYDSYSQNPEMAKKLLSTGDSKITHTQDNTRWKTDFPEIVETVRDMLKDDFTEDIKDNKLQFNIEKLPNDLFNNITNNKLPQIFNTKIDISDTLNKFLYKYFAINNEEVVGPLFKNLTDSDKRVLTLAIAKKYPNIKNFTFNDIWDSSSKEEIFYYLNTNSTLVQDKINIFDKSNLYKEYTDFVNNIKDFAETFKSNKNNNDKDTQKFNDLISKDKEYKFKLGELNYEIRESLLNKINYNDKTFEDLRSNFFNIKNGVSKLFEDYYELYDIGTQEQYSNYLDSINVTKPILNIEGFKSFINNNKNNVVEEKKNTISKPNVEKVKQFFTDIKTELDLKRKRIFTNVEISDISDILTNEIYSFLNNQVDKIQATNKNPLITVDNIIQQVLSKYGLKTLVNAVIKQNVKDITQANYYIKQLVLNPDLMIDPIKVKLKNIYGVSVEGKDVKINENIDDITENNEDLENEFNAMIDGETGNNNALNIVSKNSISNLKSIYKKLRIVLSQLNTIDLKNNNSESNYRNPIKNLLGFNSKVDFTIAFNTLMDVFSSTQNNNNNRITNSAVGIISSKDVIKTLINKSSTYPWILNLLDLYKKDSPTSIKMVDALNEFYFEERLPINRFEKWYNINKGNYNNDITLIARESKLNTLLFTNFYRQRNIYAVQFDNDKFFFINKSNSATRVFKKLKSNLENNNITIINSLTHDINKNYNLSNTENFREILQNIKSEFIDVYNSYKELNLKDELSDDNADVLNKIFNLFNIFGMQITPDEFKQLVNLDTYQQTNYLGDILKQMGMIVNNNNYDKVNSLTSFLNDYYLPLVNISQNLIPIYQNKIEESFREGGKSLYSFSASNHSNNLFRKFKDPIARQEMLNLYKQDSMLYNPNQGIFNSRWLNALNEGKLKLEQIIQLNYNKVEHSDFSNGMTLSSAANNYLNYLKIGGKDNTALYAGPVIGDADAYIIYQAPRYPLSDVNGNTVYNALAENVYAECKRISIVKGTKIAFPNNELYKYISGEKEDGSPEYSETPFAKNAVLFHTFPMLNEEKYFNALFGTKEKEGIFNMKNTTRENKIKAIEEFLSENGIFDNAVKEIEDTLIEQEVLEKNEGVYRSDVIPMLNSNLDYNIEELIRDFALNDWYAQSQIHLIINNDPAQFKGIEDNQKRTKQVYSPGQMYDKETWTSIMGRPNINYIFVSDKVLPSNSITDIEEAINSYNLSTHDKESIINSYKNIETTDGQAYITLKARRAKKRAIGEWSNAQESAYNNIQNDNYTKRDLDLIQQEPDKPQVYTKIPRTVGNDKIGKYTFLMGTQLKNSEYVIFPTTVHSNNNPISNSKEVFIAKFMEDHNIDVLAFNTNVKVGLMNNINYSNFMTTVQDYAETNNKNLDFANKYITPIDIADVKLQQKISSHFYDEVQSIGVQSRKIIMTDLPNNLTFNNEEFSKEQFLEIYKRFFEASYAKGYEGLKELFESKESLIEFLKEQGQANTKYSSELVNFYDSASANELPLFDPSNTKIHQQFLSAAVLNRIIRLKMKGGSLIQVSASLTDNLKVVFEGKGKDKHIAYVETIIPWSMKEQFLPALDNKGYVDINKLNPEVLKVIGYRIPSEAKYSVFPLQVVGFSDKSAGATIMLPNDLMIMAGFDFDIDKLFIMLPEVETTTLNRKSLQSDIYHLVKDKLKIDRKTFDDKVSMVLDEIENGDINFKENSLEMAIYDFYESNKDFYKSNELQKVSYSLDKNNLKGINENLSQKQLNNLFFDMVYSVLTTPKAMEQMLIPGGFEDLKKVDRIMRLKEGNPSLSLTELNQKSLKTLNSEIKKVTTKSIYSLKTRMELIKLNFIAAKLIAIDANQVTNHPIAQLTDMKLKQPISIFSRKNPLKSLSNETVKIGSKMLYVSKRIASSLSASVDAVKDTVLGTSNINTFTIDVASLLTRGATIKGDCITDLEIALLLNQPIVRKMTTAFENNTLGVQKGKLINNFINEITAKHPDYENRLDTTDFILDKQELENDLNTKDYDTYNQYKVLMKYLELAKIAGKLSKFTNLTKVDTSSGSLSNTISDSVFKQQELEDLKRSIETNDENFPFEMKNPFISSDDYIKLTNAEKERHAIVPILNEAYEYGINKPLELFTKYFPYTNPLYKNMTKELSKLGNISKEIESKAVEQFTIFLTTRNNKLQNEILNSKENYKDFVYNFPKELINYLSDTKTPKIIKDLEILKILTPNKISSDLTILELNLDGNLSSPQRDAITDSWKDLYDYLPELATKLVMYEFLRNGLTFNSNSFGHLAPINVIQSMTNYYRDINDILEMPYDESITKEFTNQFVRNNIKSFNVPEIKSSKCTFNKDYTTFKIPLTNNKENKSIYKIVDTTKFNEYKTSYFILNDEYMGDLYYNKVDLLGIPSKFMEYNMFNSDNSSIFADVNTEAVDLENLKNSDEIKSVNKMDNIVFTDDYSSINNNKLNTESILKNNSDATKTLDEEGQPICEF